MRANAQKIELEMARNHMNIGDLAAAGNVNCNTVTRVIRGYDVRPATFGKIANALHVDPEDILAK